MAELKGIIPALITPLDDQERVQEQSLRKLIDYVISGGVHGVFVLGSTGEFYGLDMEEKKRAVEITMDQVQGRVPVLVGASAITTRECVRITQMAKACGADAVSVLTPYLITPNDQELYHHYRTVAECADIPMTLYNNPDRTHVNLSAALVEKLADLPTIVGVKDSSGDLTLTSEYIRRTRGKNFEVMAGRDTMILATLVYGGVGAVAATANIVPELVVEIYNRFIVGDITGALEAQYKLAPLRLSFGLGSWPVMTRDALNLMGMNVGNSVRPIESMPEQNLAKLREVLKNLNIPLG
ncbi:MAG: 4-hydroxy-tetrahydrodipicolinate synthase [Desulfitobacteriaceae bacterium]